MGGKTTNYNWDIGTKGQFPWFAEWQTLWGNIDIELYKRSKDLFMQGHGLYGSDGSAGDLHLYSTSHATKGKIYFGANSAYDEVNNRLGIGTTSPTDSVTMVNAGGTAGFSIDSGSGVSYKYDWISMKHDGVMRWSIFKLNDADGSLMIGRYNDAGAFQDTPLFISRFNGDITLTGNLFMGNGKNFYIGSDAGTAPNTWFDSSIGVWDVNRKAYGYSNGFNFRTSSANKWFIGLDTAEDDLFWHFLMLFLLIYSESRKMESPGLERP